MPNWVRSKITGISFDDIEPYISMYDNGEKYLDFEKIIPMPKGLMIESGSRQRRGLDIIDKNMLSVEFISHLSKEDRECLDIGFKALYNKLHYGVTDWYDWSWEKWGTKWNSHDCYFSDNTTYISTAWNCPIPIFRKLSELLQKEISVVYANEDCGYNTGECIFENGEMIDCNRPDGGTREAFELYNLAWDNDIPIVMRSDGSWELDWGDEE